MPKRKVKEEKPRKRLGKKELLIPPAAMGISLLTPHLELEMKRSMERSVLDLFIQMHKVTRYILSM